MATCQGLRHLQKKERIPNSKHPIPFFQGLRLVMLVLVWVNSLIRNISVQTRENLDSGPGSTDESGFCISGTTPSPQTSGYDLSRFPSSTTVVTSQGNLKIQLLKVFSTNEVYSTCDFSANIQISSSRKTGFLHKKQLYKLYKD